ncbi:cyclic AMP-responsive element-binding protein 3-like protein 3 isoform X2 [Amblyraja radiata]|uniref:cyclic AMP-responsive element-binding protein 3-like protein 3 isoform X2 n=1 Tax=Amblyraja radiata TaxID=386614 RepID=UPI001403FE5A|nr:cyclic AMP-responsive element-binding protein 3-like protein 3 isoform X2 [Amblyraja radiata]
MTLVTGRVPGECLTPRLDSVELLDLLFDQQDGILRHENFHANGMESTECWEMAQPSIHNGRSNEEILSSILAEAVPASPLWSSAGSDSGISEDQLSDQLDSPQQPFNSPRDFESFHRELPFHPGPVSCCPDPCPGVPDVTYPDVDFSINCGDWNTEALEEGSRNIPTQPATNNFLTLTVKDLLLSNMSEKNPPQPFHARELVLNEDEKKLLMKEGTTLPSQLPLTKQEERVLKKIRRKIRNKQSAQESRKKKKQYIDGLENRMAACAAQNHELQRKVIHLEKQNTTLLQQLRKLQALVMHSTGKTAQTSTCIMVLVLSFSLIIFPSFSSFSSNKGANEGDFTPIRVFSRSLHNVESTRVLHMLAKPQHDISAGKKEERKDQLTLENTGMVSEQVQTVNDNELTGVFGSLSLGASDALLRNGTAPKDITILEDLDPEEHSTEHGHSLWTKRSSSEKTANHGDEM